MIAQFIVTTLRSATPLIIAAVAGLFCIRAGIFHLGIEGLMLTGAFVSVVLGSAAGNAWIGLLGAVAVNAVLSWAYWLLIDRLKADTVIAGLGLSTLCYGATTFLMAALFGERGSLASDVRLPQFFVGANSGLAAALNNTSILVWSVPVIVWIGWVGLARSRLGLEIAVVGEYPYGAECAGLNIGLTRLKAVLITGVGAAIAGAELGNLANFTQNMTNGRGFFALAAILFGGGRPVRTALAGLFFGFSEALGIAAQISAFGGLPRQFILMIPFVATIVIVTLSRIWAKRRDGRDSQNQGKHQDTNIGEPRT